jgi:hypothetical protein
MQQLDKQPRFVKALDKRCPVCGAEPGERCIDQRLLKSGHRIENYVPHGRRIYGQR